jgi:hypothetical protein
MVIYCLYQLNLSREKFAIDFQDNDADEEFYENNKRWRQVYESMNDDKGICIRSDVITDNTS